MVGWFNRCSARAEVAVAVASRSASVRTHEDPTGHRCRLGTDPPLLRRDRGGGETYAYPEDLSSEQAKALWLEPPPGQTVVAVDETTETVLGSAKMGPNRPARGSHVATASFMVSPAARGRGVGRALGST